MVVLATYADGNGLNCFPSVETLALDVGAGRRDIQRDLKELENSGHITREENKQGGRGKTRGYQLHIPVGRGKQFSLDLKSGPNTAVTPKERAGIEAPKLPISKALNCRFSPVPNKEDHKYTSKNIVPGEPAGNPPSICSEISPEDLPSISFAQHVVTELCLQHENGMVLAVAGAIDFCVKFESKTKSSATEYLIALARDEITHGGSPTRFWFTDRKWRKANGNGTSKADRRSADVRETAARVRDRALAAIGDSPGRLQEQVVGTGTAAVDHNALARGGKVLDAGGSRGDHAHDKKSAVV
jgi:hypothetical protein